MCGKVSAKEVRFRIEKRNGYIDYPSNFLTLWLSIFLVLCCSLANEEINENKEPHHDGGVAETAESAVAWVENLDEVRAGVRLPSKVESGGRVHTI